MDTGGTLPQGGQLTPPLSLLSIQKSEVRDRNKRPRGHQEGEQISQQLDRARDYRTLDAGG